MSEPKTLRESRAEARAEARAKRADRRAEAARRAAATPHAQAQQSRIDALMGPLGEYFESTGFWNNGWWEADTLTAAEASTNLMERLLEFLPEKRGAVLDVACGYGATTQCLTRHFPPASIAAVDISDAKLEYGRRNAPGCAFERMDATHLTYPDASFDVVLCVESAFQFESRRRFLAEARRVLRPGGRLLIADILHEPRAEALSRRVHPENYLKDPAAYVTLLASLGYTAAEVIDATEPCWTRSVRDKTRFVGRAYWRGAIDRPIFNRIMTAGLLSLLSTRYYVLASATRPLLDPLPESAA
ncbi:MAG TPA: methyltransferase domain-containing protein [Dongiaceae bacterium]|nr:methyltransferase domain-containing protein [Dongiaceae bacterium]